jgi:hypothetical protein
MPATDEELHRWLASQSNVEGAEVWRNDGELRIHFRRRFWRVGPNLGDFTSPFERFGYKGFTKSTMTGSPGWGF